MFAQKDSRSLILIGLSGLLAGVLGVINSFITISTFVEISINGFFSIYFGVLFILIGGIIVLRIVQLDEADSIRKITQYSFGCLIILSGFISFILEKNWFINLSPTSKIPLYAILGISVSSSLAFALVDLINYLSGFCQKVYEKAPIESINQVMIVLGASSCMGVLFGITFGAMDVEDKQMFQIKASLAATEYYCYPIGFVLGGLCGVTNEYIRQSLAEKTTDDFNNEC